MLLTRRTERMRDFFMGQSPRAVRRWQPKLWLGFSAEDQKWFDRRWRDVRPLAQAGWFVFVSVAPMLGPVTLPGDFLALGRRTWVIVAGEEGTVAPCRDMEPRWARAVRDQCLSHGVPFFMRQMSADAPIPRDLLVRQFPVI
jgi:protein gp37